MKYSIIVATYNRSQEIKELLETALKLDFPSDKFEFVIIDDGSTDDTSQVIKAFQEKAPFQIQYIFQKNKGPGEARNTGMRQAQGEYFLFVDSDVLLPENWLINIDHYLAQNALDAFGGPDTDHPSFPPLLKAINYAMTSFIGTAGTRGSKKSLQKKFYPRSFNMGISRKVWQAVGDMSSLRHGQDMDYSARIYEKGFTVGLIPEAYVYHKRRTSFKKFFKQIFNWGIARVNLWRRHKNMLKWIHLVPTFLLFGIVVSIFLPLIVWWGKFLLWAALAGIGLISLWGFLESFLRYKSLKISFMAVLALWLQITAYGLGVFIGFLQILFGKKEARGFVKNYYR
jgi:glycosyltransferase involved in cell wall biosynthesis